MQNHLSIALLQISMLHINSNKLEQYLRIAKEQNAAILAMGEYVLNPFINHLQNASKQMLNINTNIHIDKLKKYSKQYKISIIAPLLYFEKSSLLKVIAIFENGEMRYMPQQRLINYSHWDEKKLFSNKNNAFKNPLFLESSGFKIAIISGFEVHFDEIWIKIKKAKCDAVIMPCANALGSQKRWKKLCQVRAFLNSLALLRVNRIGNEIIDDIKWEFYGDSLFVDSNGEIEDRLDNKEGLLIATLDKNEILDSKKQWCFVKT